MLDPFDIGRSAVHITTAVGQHLEASLNGPALKAAISQPGAVSHLAFSGDSGQKVYTLVNAATFPDRCGVLKLLDPQGKLLGSGCIIDSKSFIDTVVLPVNGRYVLEVDGEADDTGTAEIRLMTVGNR